ncbi:MAG: isocitrate/isopropylmalate family dehydrogenase, partial [Candidatus Deferrimicrobiaceae bacterium]
MKEIRLALIPGDGIGTETVAAGKKVLDTVAEVHGGVHFRYEEFDWSCEHYAKHGRMMPENGLDLLAQHDAIYLGAVGYPGVPDHVSLWGLLIPIRRTFQQYISLRPVQLLPGVRTPLANRQPEEIDFF